MSAAAPIGVISNPLSHRNRRRIGAVRRVAAERPGVLYREIAGVDGVPALLAEFARRNVACVAVNGGDGTVQAVLTALFVDRPFGDHPPLAVIAAGRSNAIARDVGLAGQPEAALARLFDAAAQGGLDRRLVRRPVLRVTREGGNAPLYGMLFGAAEFCHAIERCRAVVHPWGMPEGLAVGLTIAGELFRLARGRVRGHPLTVRLDDGPPQRAEPLLVLVTTLERLLCNIRPRWGEGAGGLRYLSLPPRPGRLLRAAPGLLFGAGEGERAPDGYVARRARRISVEMDGRFVLDGQFHTVPAGTELRLDGEAEADFVRL